MSRSKIFAVSLVMLIAQIGPTLGQGFAPPAPEIDRSGKGAVLCARQLTIHVREVAAFCHPDAARAYVATLDWAIEQYDQFIIDNSATTREALERDRDGYVKAKFPASANRKSVCQRGNFDHGEKFFLALRAEDLGKMKADVRDQLSIRRKPVMNPCM